MTLPIHSEPGYLIRRAHQIAWAAFMEVAKDTGTTPVQYAALVAIRAGTGIEVRRLSEMIALDAATIGSVIDRLEAKGLVRRQPGKADRRTKLIFITPSGERLVDNIGALTELVAEKIFLNFTRPERAEFVKLLLKLIGDGHGIRQSRNGKQSSE